MSSPTVLRLSSLLLARRIASDVGPEGVQVVDVPCASPGRWSFALRITASHPIVNRMV